MIQYQQNSCMEVIANCCCAEEQGFLYCLLRITKKDEDRYEEKLNYEKDDHIYSVYADSYTIHGGFWYLFILSVRRRREHGQHNHHSDPDCEFSGNC